MVPACALCTLSIGFRLKVAVYLQPHTMFIFWDPILVLGFYNHKGGYPTERVWYEPTSIHRVAAPFFLAASASF